MTENLKIGVKEYAPPKLQCLTPEQTNLLLIGQSTVGDPGAKDLLGLLYPEPQWDTA